MHDPVFLWCRALVYRGYMICPVDSGLGSLFGIAVFDPFGMHVGDDITHQLVASFEQVWEVGKVFIDKDLREMEEELPGSFSLIPQ